MCGGDGGGGVFAWGDACGGASVALYRRWTLVRYMQFNVKTLRKPLKHHPKSLTNSFVTVSTKINIST